MLQTRRLVAVVSLLGTGLLGSWDGVHASSPAPPPAGTTCTWGGTAADPTGSFSITPGLTNDPSTAPSRFFVTGELSGGPGCQGTLTYIGQIDAGGTCAYNFFDGAARGLPGVTSFAGVGAGPLGPARLYDGDGNVVASENADVTTAKNIPHFLDCRTPDGFSGGNFHSGIVFTS
jgi:hypothetical protein